MQENYLLIVEKREESKVFECVGKEFREGERENLPRKVLQKCPKLFVFFFYLRVFIVKNDLSTSGFGNPLVVVEFDVDINNLSLFPSSTSDAYLKVFPNSN